MGVILLEALGALLALVLIVWWTMFSGRPKGELPVRVEPPSAAVQPPASPPDKVHDPTTEDGFAAQPPPQPPADKA